MCSMFIAASRYLSVYAAEADCPASRHNDESFL